MRAKPDVYYLFHDGQTKGPCTLADLHEMWDAGQVTLNTLFVQPGPWRSRPLSHILEKVIGYQKPAGGEIAPPVDEAKASITAATYFVTAVGIALLVWVLGPTLKPSPDSSRTLKAEVELVMTRVSVFNGNSYDWMGKTVVLNGKPPLGYKRKIAVLKSGEVMTLPLTDFADQTGFRFEPWRMLIEEIWIGDDQQGYQSFPPPRNQGPLLELPLQ